jgi:hypothetical protein
VIFLRILFGLPWNVVENKGPKMRKMGRMRLPWNVYENKWLKSFHPGMSLINKMVSRFWLAKEAATRDEE